MIGKVFFMKPCSISKFKEGLQSPVRSTLWFSVRVCHFVMQV